MKQNKMNKIRKIKPNRMDLNGEINYKKTNF